MSLDDPLTQEVVKAKRAKQAYQDFIGPFVKSKKQVLFEAFQLVDISNVDSLLEIRRMVSVVDALDTELREYIDAGLVAQATIDKMSENDD